MNFKLDPFHTLSPKHFFDNGVFYKMVGLGSIVFFLLLAFVILLYVFKSIGLYKLARTRNIKYAGLAWFPLGDMYILGMLVQSINIGKWEISYIQLVLLFGGFFTLFLGELIFLGKIITTVYLLVSLISLLKLYTIYRPQNSVTWLVLSIIFPFLIPFFIFAIRPKTQPVQQNYQYQQQYTQYNQNQTNDPNSMQQ